MRDILGEVCAYDMEWAGMVMRRYPDQHRIIRTIWRCMMASLMSARIDKKEMLMISTSPLVRLTFVFCYAGAPWSIGCLSAHDHLRTETARILLAQARIIIRKTPQHYHEVRRVAPCDPIHAEQLLRSGGHIHHRVLRAWSRNPSFPLLLIIEHYHRRWDWVHVWRLRRITPDHMVRLTGLCRMNYKLLSVNPFLSVNHVMADMTAPWDWRKLAIHPSMPPQDIIHITRLVQRWRFEDAMLNPRINDDIYHQVGARFRWIHSKNIMANGLRCSHAFRMWALSRVRNFMIVAIKRQRLLQRTALIGSITHRIPPPITLEILRFTRQS